MKYCKDCKYLSYSIWCDSPNNGIDLVTGKSKPMHAITARQHRYCGLAAKWFEPKPKLWWELWK